MFNFSLLGCDNKNPRAKRPELFNRECKHLLPPDAKLRLANSQTVALAAGEHQPGHVAPCKKFLATFLQGGHHLDILTVIPSSTEIPEGLSYNVWSVMSFMLTPGFFDGERKSCAFAVVPPARGHADHARHHFVRHFQRHPHLLRCAKSPVTSLSFRHALAGRIRRIHLEGARSASAG